MIKRRGKLGLIAVNKKFAEVKEWVIARMGKDQKIGNAVGKLRTFIIEPFIPHKEVSVSIKIDIHLKKGYKIQAAQKNARYSI